MSKTQRKKRRWPKVIRIFITALLLIVVLFSASYLVLKIVADQNDTFPGFFGMEFAPEMTDHMEPKIDQGSLMIMKPAEENKVGDVVVFVSSEDENQFITAEITEKKMVNEINVYRMQYANGEVQIPGSVAQTRIRSVVHYSIPWLGYAVDFVDSIPGVIALIVFPCLLIIVIEIVRMVRIVRQKEDEDEFDAEVERDVLFQVEDSDRSDQKDQSKTTAAGLYFRDLSAKEKGDEPKVDTVANLAELNNKVVLSALQKEQEVVQPQVSIQKEEKEEVPQEKKDTITEEKSAENSEQAEKILTDVDRMIQEILKADRVPSDVIQRLKTVQSEEDPYGGLNPEIGSHHIKINFDQKKPQSVSIVEENGYRYLIVVTEDGQTKIKIDF